MQIWHVSGVFLSLFQVRFFLQSSNPRRRNKLFILLPVCRSLKENPLLSISGHWLHSEFKSTKNIGPWYSMIFRKNQSFGPFYMNTQIQGPTLSLERSFWIVIRASACATDVDYLQIFRSDSQFALNYTHSCEYTCMDNLFEAFPCPAREIWLVLRSAKF